MSELHASRVTGVRNPWQKERSQPAITAALIASCLAMFLCFLATVFGLGPEGEWLSLPPDYTGFGWAIRLLGGALGMAALICLYLIHRRGRKRSRRHRHSFAGKMVRLGMALSLISITWEIAVLGLVVLLGLALVYGLFGEGGF